MTLASQFRGDIQAETLSSEGADKPAVSLAQQFSSAPLADSVGRSLNAAKNTTPDRTLSAIKLSEQTGLPLDAVERNHDQILVDVKQRETDPIEIARGNPSLARWLANPNNAALGQNDVGILRRIEGAIPDPALMMDPGRQFTSEVVRLPGTVLSGTGNLLESTTRMVDRLTFGSISSVDQFLQRHVGRPPDWVDPAKALKAAGQPFKEGADVIAVPEERQNLVTDISGAIGQLSTQVVQAYVAPQTLVPSLLAQGADIQAERVEQQGASGTPESDAAILTGAGVTALLEKVGISQLINRLPPQVKNSFLRGAADIVAAGGIEAGQELVENIAQNVITQQLVNPDQQIIDGDTWREVTAAGGAAAFLRAVIQAATKGRSREQGQKDQQTLDSIVEANDQTWLKQNAPEKLQEFIAGAKQAGADTVYIPVEAATTYFQTANLDMSQVLAAAGVDRQDILAAQATGGDIPIPIEIYTVALSEHHKAGLREIARINPEASAPAEAQDAESERQNIDAEVRRIFDAAQEDEPGKIKEDVVSQLVAIGQDADTADKYGALIDKAFTTIGRRSGIDPTELYNRYRLKITREGMEGISNLSLQTGRPSITLSQYSPDEVEFFRSMGIPVEQNYAEPRSELPATENLVTVGGGAPRAGWAENTSVSGTDGPVTVYRGSRDGTTSAADFDATGAATGHPSAGLGVWLSADRGDAARYGTVGEYQLDLRNPKVYSIEDFPGFDSIEESRALREQLQAQGHDGVVIDARNVGGPVQFVVFSPESVIPAARVFAQSSLDEETIAFFRNATINATKERGGTVLDNGNVKLYHGTSVKNASSIKKSKKFKNYAFFTHDKAVAERYSRQVGGKTEVLEVEIEPSAVLPTADYFSARTENLVQGDDGVWVADDASVLSQQEGVERGQIRIAPSGVEIRLFEKANLSTFLHEGGHLFLELLGDIATNPDAPQQIKDDYAAALKWLGVESRGQIGVEQHEKWARGFELYLGEGRAPSPELTGIFSRFRAWMIAIYKSLKNLNVELSDEVRGVFDRLIATDEEISASQPPPGFQTQEESGMTDKQWIKYQELLTEARAETEGQLTARAYGEIKREKEAWWKERLAEVSAEVEAEANEMPVYQAWAFLAEGKYPDGREYDGNLERQKLDKSVLLSMYGQEFLNKTLRYKHVYQQEGGHHPSLVASQFGYESASIMIEQLAAAPKKSEYVTNESRRRMLEQYGDIVNDGSLPEQAVKAAHNDRRFKAIEVELEALGRLIGRAPPKVAQLRQLADNMIGEKKAREIQPYLYLKAERKAAKDYAELAAKGQRAQAYEAKQRQLLNGLLYDRAWKAKEEVDQIREYANGLMKKPKQEKLAKAGGSYLQQVNDILAAYQFRKLPLKQVDRQENLRQWVDRMQEEGDITAVPEEVIRRVEGSPTNYQNATLNELRGVRDSLKNIDHLSKLKNKLLKSQELRDKDEARDEMLGRLKETHPNRKTLAASEFAKTKAEQMGDSLKGLADALWRPETIIEAMDGGESGPWHDYLWEPANQARAVQNRLREKVGVPLEELAKSLDRKWQSALDDEWQIAGRKMTRRDIIGMALNLGNDGNRDKLMRGGYIADGVRRQYTNEDIESAISHLTSQDWDMIQTVWDTVNSLWPEIVAQQQRLSGLPPEKIESTPFVVNTADGQTMTMRGGYFPLAYDPRQSQVGEKQASSENAADALLSGQYSRAATPKGHLKERTGYAAPIQLDYQAVLTRHMDDVITDLSHREFLKQAQWIVSDTQIKNSVMERIGETGYKALRGFIGHTVGADRPIPDSSAKAWQRISDQIIANTAVYALGFRVVTAWGNLVVAPIQAVARVKPQYMVRGFTQFYSNLRESTDFVHSLSPFMRNRARDLDASYVEVMNTLGGNRSIRRQIARASMQVHRWADYLGTHGIWLGRYQQAIDSGAPQEEAARLADKAIRQTQTAGAPKDLSGVERDPTFKMFRLFIGPMLIMNNRIRESVTKKGVIDTWPEALGTMMAAWFLPAVIFELAVGRGPEEDDEPEDWYKWMATKVGMYPMQTIPLVRDIAATAEAQILGEYRQVRAAPIAEAGNAVVKAFATTAKEIEAADEIEDIDAGKVSKDTLRALGPIFGLPTNQVDVTGSFIFDVMTKEYEPDSPLDYRYLLVRRPKEEQ